MGRYVTLFTLVLVCSLAVAGEPEIEKDTRKWTDRIDFNGWFILPYEAGTTAGEDFSRFFVNRAYLTAEASILPILDARITLDTTQDLEGQGRGDMEVRLKYAFAKFRWKDRGVLNDPNLEVGIVHMVWLDFEEHIDLYRMRGPMFMERSGIFNSADFGITFASGLGADMDEAFRSYAGNKYGTRNGSMAIGLYNGAGYHGDERNVGKTAELRLTWRPLPDRVKGWQVAGLIINGEGNVDESTGEVPNWETYNLFTSYQFLHGTVTAQYVWGEGNQRGNWIEPDDPGRATPYSGWSVFGEWRTGRRHEWRVIGGYDRFDRETDTGVDRSFTYAYLGLGYDFGKENILMLDVAQRDWVDPDRETDQRLQVVMQVRF